MSARSALREAGFWWLTFAFAVCLFVTVALTVHLIPYLVQHGHSPTFAATVAGLFGLMTLAGRLTIGPLGDRYPRRWVTAGLIGLQVAGLAVLALSPTVVGALVYVVLFGAGSGTLTIMRAALLAERYGPEHYGSISGTMSLVLSGARTLAPIGAGILAGLFGGYTVLLWILMACAAAGLVAVLQLTDT